MRPRDEGPANTRAKQIKKLKVRVKTGTPTQAKKAYSALPLEDRKAVSTHIAGKYGLRSDAHHAALSHNAKPTRQERAVLGTHAKRIQRDEELLHREQATRRQSVLLDSFKRSHSYRADLALAEKHRQITPLKQKASDVNETDPARLAALGFKVDHSKLNSVISSPKYALGALASGSAVAEAAYHDPIGVPLKTAKQALDAIPALPGEAVDLATHPIKTIKAQAKEFAKRSSQPYEERVKQIRKEGGLAYGSDAALVLGPTGMGARLGLKAARADTERAAVRVTGETPKARRNAGIVRDAVGTAVDNRRAAKHERALREAEAGGAPVDALVQQAAEANRRAGRTVEVVGRFAGRRQVKGVAKLKGHGHYGFKRDQGVRLGAARKLINKLDKHEKRAFYYAALGIRTPEQAVDLLPKLRTKIEDTRKTEGVVVKGSLKKSDMLPDIDAILAEPLKHFTPRLAEVMDAIAPDARRAGHEDPSFDEGIDRGRRHAPLADLFDMERGVGAVPLVKPKVTLAEAQTARIDHAPSSPVEPGRVGPYEVPAPEGGLTPRAREERRRIVQEMTAGTDRRRVEDRRARERFAEIGPNGAARAQAQAIVAGALREVPGHRYADETDKAFTDRLAAEAKSRGLAEPLYFKSERYVGPRDFAAHALGGIRAAATDQHYKGVNLRQGLQDTSPEQFLRGNARSIKRKHNWELVASIAERNTIGSLSRDGSTVSAIRETAAKDGVDPGSFALWNPGVMRRFAQQHVGDATDERFVQPEEFDIASVDAGLKHSTIRVNEHGQAVDGTGKLVDAGELAKTNGWVAVPDAVLKELEAQMVPSGKGLRAWDIAKGKASRAMLLTGNIPWLGFQVASNTAMGAAATGGRILNPANWVHARKDWHSMSHEEQMNVGSHHGLDATSADTNQRKLGASTNNDFVNAYRAFKAHPMWHTGLAGGNGPSISELNPLELMARADRGQNNIFRIVAGYSLAKRDTVRRMGESMGRAERAQLKLVSIFKMPPEAQLRALRHDPEMLERHGDAVADWMGDYSSMTANERKALGRVVMFYPYIRYSLKLLFWTLPVKHPAVTAVLAEMGNMKAEELKKILGEDSLPFNIGKIYFGKNGDVKSIDLRRANPALNSVVDAARNRSLSQAVGIAPPFVGWLYNQVAQENNFTGKDWMVQGRTRQFGGPELSPADPLRLRILADDVLSIAFPYRLAQHMEFNPAKDGPIPFVDGGEDTRLAGAQGDDSLIFSPRPTHFGGKHPDTLAKLQAKFSDRRERFEEDHESLIHELIPMLPSADRGRAETREAAIIKKAEQPKGKKKAGGYGFKGDRVKTPHFGKKSSSSGGYKFGGG